MAGSVLKIQPSKFQYQNILESCFDVEILRALSSKVSLPLPILVLLTVPKDMEDPVQKTSIDKL